MGFSDLVCLRSPSRGVVEMRCDPSSLIPKSIAPENPLSHEGWGSASLAVAITSMKLASPETFLPPAALSEIPAPGPASARLPPCRASLTRQGSLFISNTRPGVGPHKVNVGEGSSPRGGRLVLGAQGI